MKDTFHTPSHPSILPIPSATKTFSWTKKSHPSSMILKVFVCLIFYPPKGDMSYLQRGPIDATSLIFFVLVNKYGTSKTYRFYRLFFASKCLSPEGRCEAYPVGVQLRIFPFIEFWDRRGILGCINPYGLSTFFCFKMFNLTGWTGGTDWTVLKSVL